MTTPKLPALPLSPLARAIRGAGGGGQPEQHTPIESPDSLHSTAFARVLDIISEGPIVGLKDGMKSVFFNETPLMNEDGSYNFQNVVIDLRLGTQDQEYIKGFESTANEIAVGIELTDVTPWTQAFNNLDLSGCRIRLSTPMLSKVQDDGDTVGYRVDYVIEMSVDGGAYTTVLPGSFNGKTTTKFERSHRIDFPPATVGWTIRVRRLTANSTTSSIQDKTYIESFTEVIDVKLRYPNTALVGVHIDAKQFQSIPGRAYHILGLEMKYPSNYNPTTRAYTGVWDGTFSYGWTNNPAWAFYLLATNPRFGLGKYVTEAMIDKWKLYEIAKYCDELVPDGFGGMEPRFTCNLCLTTQAEAFKVMQDLASVFRGLAFWANSMVNVNADKPGDPVYTYTNANVVKGLFTYAGSGKKTRHTVCIVTWNDLQQFGKQKFEYVEDKDGIARYGVRQTSIVAFGCTSRGQAHRAGKWLLASELLETDSVTFAVSLDGTIAAPGQVVRIADATRAGKRIGGRVKAATVTTVTLDKIPPAIAVGNTVSVIMADATVVTRTISAIDAPNNKVTVSVAFPTVPSVDSVWVIESSTLEAQRFRIMAVTEGAKDEGGGITFAITAVQHREDKFDYVDFNTKLDPPAISKLVSPVQKPPTNVVVTHVHRAGEVIASMALDATWTAAVGASYYEVSWQHEHGDWSAPRKVFGLRNRLEFASAGRWKAKVIAFNAKGWASPPEFSDDYDLPDMTLLPGYATNLQLEVDDAAAQAAAANAALADIASDNKLTPVEKKTVIANKNAIIGEQSGIDAQATAYSVTTEKTAYDNAITALTSYLATLTTPTLWSDLSGTTNVVGSTFRQKFLDVYNARQVLLNKIYANAKVIGDNAQAAANAAQTDATTSLTALTDIATDGKLTPGEKKEVIRDYTELTNGQAAIDAQATTYNVTTEKTNYDAAITALTSYLATLTSPYAWNSMAGNTTVDRTTFRQKFLDAYSTRQAVLQRIADLVTFGNTAGQGPNLLLSEYSYFDSGTLPPLSDAGGVITPSFDVTVPLSATDAGSLQFLVNDAAGNISSSWCYLGASATDYNVRLDGGRKYILSSYFRSTSSTASVRFTIKMNDGALLNPIGGDQALGPSNTWVRKSWVLDLTAYSGAVAGVLLLYCNRQGQTTAFKVFIDRLMLEEKVGNLSTPSGWIPGSGGNLARQARDQATSAQSDATSALNSLSDISNDSLLTPAEKKLVITDYNAILNAKTGLDNQATAFGIITEKTAYDNAITALTSYLATLTSPTAWNILTGSTTIVRTTFRQKFYDAYSAWDDLTNAIYEAAQNLANGKVAPAGANVIPNPTFVMNDRGAPDNSANITANGWAADGWQVFPNQSATAVVIRNWAGTGNKGILTQLGQPTLANGASALSGIVTGVFPVEQSAIYLLNWALTQQYNGTVPAGLSVRSRLVIDWLDTSGAHLSYSIIEQARGATNPGQQTVQAPATANGAKLQLYVYVTNNTGASWTHDSTVVMRSIWQWVSLVRQVANTGNLPMLMYGNGRAKVPTVVTYSASAGTPATATISVAAFSIISGSRTIPYNAMSVGVSHAAGTVQYFLYCDDPVAAGGTQTLVATTNGDDVYKNEGRLYIGDVSVTFPASGTTSGGGGRVDSCVCLNMHLAEGLMAGEAELGQIIDVLDLPISDIPFRRAIQGLRAAQMPCVRLTTDGGAVLELSEETPFDLLDRRTAAARDMFGELVVTDHGIERVVSVERIGLRWVARLSVGGVSYAAGRDPKHRIYSHNALKP